MMYELENIRIIRDAKNYATRTTNFDTANIIKTINTSNEVIKKIKVYKLTPEYNNEPLRNKLLYKLREENPELSLQQLL